MEFREVVRRRRMIRRFEQRPIPADVLDGILDIARRGPSAGFSQGLEFLVLDTPETVAAFWVITRDPEFGWDLEDVALGPTAIVLPLPDASRYVERYSQPDKIAFGMDQADHWPVPFWDVDAAMAAMLVLLTAVDEGLGACFFGIPPERLPAFRAAFGVPDGFRPVGCVSVGYPGDGDRRSPSLRRGRRSVEEVVHRGSW